MGNIFRDSGSHSSNLGWTTGLDKNNDNNNDNYNNTRNKKRRNDQNFNSRRNTNGDGESSNGYGNNFNRNSNRNNSYGNDYNNNNNHNQNWNKFQKKRRQGDWEFDNSRKIRDSDSDRLVIDWTANSYPEIENPSKSNRRDQINLPKKSIATQTDFPIYQSSIGVQTESINYFVPVERRHEFNQLHGTVNTYPGIIYKDNYEMTNVQTNVHQPFGALRIPVVNEDTSANRDPRVARRSRIE